MRYERKRPFLLFIIRVLWAQLTYPLISFIFIVVAPYSDPVTKTVAKQWNSDIYIYIYRFCAKQLTIAKQQDQRQIALLEIILLFYYSTKW
jgi:hypothetical protein